jgi:hypothetical protein
MMDSELSTSDAGAAPTPPAALAHVSTGTRELLLRMFADPHLLEVPERVNLVASLRACVAAHPDSSDLRVLLGMALCVNYEVEDATEELREGVRLAPDSYIAQLKLGELWMRLRVCDKAEEHTRRAALLARNPVQSELARRQAATIRDLVRRGIQRGGRDSACKWQIVASLRELWNRRRPKAPPALEAQ